MCSIDLEPCSVWSDTVVVARKEHQCDCCDGTIRPGAEYTRHFSVFDGNPTSEKRCAPCTAMCERFRKAHGQLTTPSGMAQLLWDCVGEGDDESKRWRLELLNMERRAKARQRRLTKFAGAST
jgi:hypothetical protein